jgi:hypothetical protein
MRIGILHKIFRVRPTGSHSMECGIAKEGDSEYNKPLENLMLLHLDGLYFIIISPQIIIKLYIKFSHLITINDVYYVINIRWT